MFYYMVLSFLSGIVLLNMIEKEEPYRKPDFWFVLAVFVNCFCAFFIASFIRDEMVQKVWFIYNITSLISVLIFTKAFLSIKFVKT